MSISTPIPLKEKSQQALLEFSRNCYGVMNQQYDIRYQLLQLDLVYQRELDYTEEQAKAAAANRSGDPTKFQNIILPIVASQVEAKVTYQASVFLTGTPIFDWVAPPSQIDAARQFSAITEENSIRGGWAQQLMVFFKDCFKYNLAFVEMSYGAQKVAAIETDVSYQDGTEGRPVETIWRGNKLERWDPYNTIWDIRYKPSDVYKHGEFIGKTELMSRIHLKKFISELPDVRLANVVAAFESGMGYAGGGTTGLNIGDYQDYYMPPVNQKALIQNVNRYGTNWMAWAGLLTRPQGEIQYRDLYVVTTLYARILPQDFDIRVPAANTPQIWKFIIVNHQVVLYAERQTNAHNYLPVLIGQPYEDGLGYQTKSLAENTRPFQEIGSALVNSAIAARRRAISDRGIYNPLLISAAHINNDSPTAKIPMRPAAYNMKPGEAYFPIPFNDNTSAMAFQEVSQLVGFANTMNGMNPAKQGQFTKGNRTKQEYDSIMSNANATDQVISIVLEGQVFTPLKEIMKLNTLQYQQGTSIYSPTQDEEIKIDPVELRRSAVTFKISDGLIPSEKIIGGDDLATALQVLGSSEQIGSGYNTAAVFSYLMKTRNVDLSPFEKSPAQKTYEQAVSSWQMASSQVAELAKTVSMKIEGVTIDALKSLVKELLPPQPLPEQFGYDPNAQATGGGTSSAPAVRSAGGNQPVPTSGPTQVGE